jgi:hypothetical protein
MKFWIVSFDDHQHRMFHYLVVGEDYESLQDILDIAADYAEEHDPGYIIDNETLKDYGEEESGVIRLGNHGLPFDSENLSAYEISLDDLLDRKMKLRPINLDCEDWLQKALEIEHNDKEASRRACDICAAIDGGYYLWAGHLLTGATECPLTSAALAWIFEKKTEEEQRRTLEKERLELLETDHVSCPSCNAINWGDYLGTCGNCLAVIPEQIDEDISDEGN